MTPALIKEGRARERGARAEAEEAKGAGDADERSSKTIGLKTEDQTSAKTIEPRRADPQMRSY